MGRRRWLTDEPDACWPGGVSDGLSIDCGVCGRRPHLDYHVDDEFWRDVVPDEIRLGAVCLPCLDRMAHDQGRDVSRHLAFVYWTGIGKTVELWPGNVFVYGELLDRERREAGGEEGDDARDGS